MKDLLKAYEELSPKCDFKDLHGNISNIGIRVLSSKRFDFVFFEGGSCIGTATEPEAIRYEFFGLNGIYGENLRRLRRFLPAKKKAYEIVGKFDVG